MRRIPLPARLRLPLPPRLARPLGYPYVADLPETQQKALRAFWLNGLFLSMADALPTPYYTLYLLSLGATNAQIGLVNTLTQLAGAVLSAPGAVLAERWGRYKRVALVSGALSRSMWLPMLVAPWLLSGEWAVWLVILAWVGVGAFAAFGHAAWTALSADLVPARLRGGYFASRNIIMQLVQLAVIPVAGQIINYTGAPGGYQVNFALALGIAAVGIYFYSRLTEHAPAAPAEARPARRLAPGLSLLRELRAMPDFVRFVLSHTIMYFGVLIGGPFIQVYMMQEARFDVGTIGFAVTINVLATMVAMRFFGRFHDRYGIIPTMRFGVGLPLIPILWLGVTQPWQAYLVEIYSAVVWAGYNLGAFNLLLACTPDEHRPRYVAIYSTLISLVGAVGPVIGGWLLDVVSFMPVFSISGIVRAIGLILFLALVREPGKPAEKPLAASA